MALDTTVGGNVSNSYATVVEADSHLGSLYGDIPAVWDALEESDKEHRLTIAALLMNQFSFRGVKASRDQNLSFPRWWRTADEYWLQQEDEDTFVNYTDITENAPTIPTEVKYAQIEIAYQVVNHILQLDPLAFPEQKIKMFELGGSLGIEFFASAPGEGYSKAKLSSLDIVYAYLGKWLARVTGGVV